MITLQLFAKAGELGKVYAVYHAENGDLGGSFEFAFDHNFSLFIVNFILIISRRNAIMKEEKQHRNCKK